MSKAYITVTATVKFAVPGAVICKVSKRDLK